MRHYSYHALFNLSPKSEKHVTVRSKRLSLRSLFISWRTQAVLDSCWLNHWKWSVPDLMWFLNFLSYKEGLHCLLWLNILSKLSEITDLPKKSKNKQVGATLTCLEAVKLLAILNCSKSAKWVIEELEISNLDSR